MTVTKASTISSLIRDQLQHQTLTKIQGKPTFKSLTRLYTQIKGNAAAIACPTLGGGQKGFLGLVVSPTTYQRSSNVAFIRPVHPGAAPAAQGTAAQISQANRQYETDLTLFTQATALERILLAQILDAIDPDYIEEKIDDESGVLTGTVTDIMKYLFDEHGDISQTELSEMKKEVESLTLDPSKSIDTIFTAINRYANTAEAAGATETQEQLINIGMIILKRANFFASDIRKWNEKLPADKTWLNFTTHFRTALKAIKQSGGGPISNLGLHNANAIIEQIVEGVRASTNIPDNTALSMTDEIAEQQMQAHIDQLANATQTQTSMQQQIHAITQSIQQMQRQMNNQAPGPPCPPCPPPNQQQQWQPPNQPPVAPGNNQQWQNQGNQQWNNNNRRTRRNNRGGRRGFNRNGGRGGRGNNWNTSNQWNNNNGGWNNNNNNNWNNNNGGWNNRNNNRGQYTPVPLTKYCWSHGWCNHTGYECETPAPQHQPAATAQNMMGGNPRNCFWLNSH